MISRLLFRSSRWVRSMLLERDRWDARPSGIGHRARRRQSESTSTHPVNIIWGAAERRSVVVTVREWDGYIASRSVRWTVTVSPSSFPICFRSSDLIGNLCVPSPRAMKEVWNGWPSTVPFTFTRPLVWKYSGDPSITTYVHPPLFGLFCNTAGKTFFVMTSGDFEHSSDSRCGRKLPGDVIGRRA